MVLCCCRLCGSTGEDQFKKILAKGNRVPVTSKGEELDNNTSHKLQVYVDQDLSFNEHVAQLCKKLIKRIGLLRSIDRSDNISL